MGKTLFILIAFNVITAVVFADLNDGLIAHWKFDEGSGNIVFDDADGFNGELIGNPAWIDGQHGYALSFDGDDGVYITTSAGADSPLDIYDKDVTITAWVKMEDEENGGTVVARAKPHYTAYRLVTLSDGRVQINTYRSPNHWILNTTEIIDIGQWCFLVGVFDRTNGLGRIYINGIEKAYGSIGPDPYSCDDPTKIGCRNDNMDMPFSGDIDRVRIYSRVVSPEEIEELYSMEKQKVIALDIAGPNEVAEESFAQYTATAIYDNNRTDDVTNLATWVVLPDNYADISDSGLLSTYELVMPTEQITIYAQYEEDNDIVQAEKDVEIFALCPQGSVLEFDGVDDYVGIGNPASLDFKGEITIAAWIMSHNSEPWLSNIVAHGHDTPPQREFYMRMHDGEYQIGSYIKGTPDAEVLYPIPAEDINNWVHITGLYDGSDWKLYRNGELVSSQSAPRGSITVPSEWAIGARGTGTSRFFDGLIDEVLIFNRALSGDEVMDIMYYGSNGEPNLVGYWSFNEGQGQVAYDSSGYGNHGYLGSDPCNPDDSDPCWVEPGAPMPCTPRQMIERNLNGALVRKRIARQKIDEAMERERASVKLLVDEMKERQNHRLKRWIMWPILEIYKSMFFEERCKHKLQASIEALERALQWLFDESVPGWPKKAGESGEGRNK